MQNEAREIRTPNLLIWSQTRCHCAIAPSGCLDPIDKNTLFVWRGARCLQCAPLPRLCPRSAPRRHARPRRPPQAARAARRRSHHRHCSLPPAPPPPRTPPPCPPPPPLRSPPRYSIAHHIVCSLLWLPLLPPSLVVVWFRHFSVSFFCVGPARRRRRALCSVRSSLPK